MIGLTEIIIAAVSALVVAVGIRLWRRRSDPELNRIGRHDLLMKRAEAYETQSSFLRKTLADYRKHGHLSERQVEQIEKAIERQETAKRTGS
jgi:hypothetical protein